MLIPWGNHTSNFKLVRYIIMGLYKVGEAQGKAFARKCLQRSTRTCEDEDMVIVKHLLDQETESVLLRHQL